jgi:hypothetical protein
VSDSTAPPVKRLSLTADPERRQHHGATGVYILARNGDGDRVPCDIAELTRDSLRELLESKERGWVEELVAILLGHGCLRE